MRHLTKKHTLSKAKDQRDALLRALATELFTHGEIKTTMPRAKALRAYAEGIITMAKEDSVHSWRQAAKFIYDKEIGKFIDTKTGELFDAPDKDKKLVSQTVLRRLFYIIGKKYSTRQGGYTRILRCDNRRGDNAPEVILELI